MFPKSLRMGKKDFQEIFGTKSDLYLNGSCLLLKYYKRPILRLSVVISKESIKTAVKRNKVKRFIRSLIFPKISDLPLGYYIVIVKKGAIKDTINYEEISFNVNTFLSKIHKS